MKKILTALLIAVAIFANAETSTNIEEIKEQRIIVITTTNYWFANSLQNSHFTVGYTKTVEDGVTVYEVILTDSDAAIVFLNKKIDIYSK